MKKTANARFAITSWDEKPYSEGPDTEPLQTKLDKATQGCLLGVMPKARQVVEVAIEKSILKQSEQKKALDAAVASIQPDIDQYNQQVP